MEAKKWYLSKTFWAAFFSMIGIFVADKFGYEIPPMFHDLYWFGLMIILRKVTKTEVVLWG